MAEIAPQEKRQVKKLAIDMGMTEGQLVARWIREGLSRAQGQLR